MRSKVDEVLLELGSDVVDEGDVGPITIGTRMFISEGIVGTCGLVAEVVCCEERAPVSCFCTVVETVGVTGG